MSDMTWYNILGIENIDEDDWSFEFDDEDFEDEDSHTYSNEDFCFICQGTCLEVDGEYFWDDDEDDDDEDEDDDDFDSW